MKKNTINYFSFNNLFLVLCLSFSISISYFLYPITASAQQLINIDAATLLPKSTLFISPSSSTILEGTTIQVSVFINTEGKSINTVELAVNFDPTKMIMINPSNTDSIINLFVDQPAFSNTSGTMKLSGVIPNGITTSKGLVTTMTFKAVATGKAVVSISETSKVLLNDGQGTEVGSEFFNGNYTIIPKSPDGPVVVSKTHPTQGLWYNNNNFQVNWNKSFGVTDFSYVLDNEPLTIPNNEMDITSTSTLYQNLPDGVWYFHIKAKKQGVWGATTHYVAHIDTLPPMQFQPKIEFITSSSSSRALVSFSTTDVLSGIDHYEIGVVEKGKSYTKITPFIKASSPYQLPIESMNARITVRAFDMAGNITEESADVAVLSSIITFLKQYYLIIPILLILIIDFLLGFEIAPIFKNIFGTKREENVDCSTKE